MLNKLIKNQNKVFFSWVVSYAVVMIIPIIIGLSVYYQTIKVINEEVNRAHDASLQQVKTLLDGKLEEINRISSELIFNEKVKALMYRKAPLQPTEMYSLREIQSDLIKFKISNNIISGIYLYFKNNDFILSNSERSTVTDYGRIIQENFGMDPEEWLQLIRSNITREYRIVRINEGNESSNKLIFIQSVPSINIKSPDATVVILIDGTKINQMLQNAQWASNGMITVIDKRNEFLSTGKMDKLPEKKCNTSN